MEIFRPDIIEISTHDCSWSIFSQTYVFALYGDPELDREPSSGSRQMMNHFGTRFLNEDGKLEKFNESKNSTSDMACLFLSFQD